MEEQPLSVTFPKLLSHLEKLENLPLRRDSREYKEELNECIQEIKAIKSKIQHLGMFSVNESIEEVSTTQLKYLSIDYRIAKLLENKIDDRVNNLKIVMNLYLQFLYSVENYEILDKKQERKLENFKDSYHPKLSELEVSDAVLRREEKIENYKMEKELNAQLKLLNDPMTNLDNLDDEIVRDLYMKQLKLFVIEAFKNLESVLMELEMLESMGGGRPKIEELKFKGLRQIRQGDNKDDEEEDSRVKNKGKFADSFTDKLESFTAPALLSKEGKILRPFTIVSSRDKLKSKVQGTGQVLPTMSVDEFMEWELANGGMVKPAEQQKAEEEAGKVDEENHDSMDKETYRLREWDEYTDTHARGSGNTMNIG